MPETTTPTTLIKANGIHRYYGNNHAVKNLSFELNVGDILGFLGPNGAGKSTSMQIISGCLSADDGQIEINGIDLAENPTAAKQQIGYLPEQPPLYKELTVDEYLRYTAQLRAIDKNNIDACVTRAKQRCGLSQSGARLISNLSKGYQQRVGIAQAIIHSPAVIILDEPTVGLDPIQIQEIRELIKELGREHAVILSTHILPEVQAVCNRVQIIRNGQLVYHSHMDALEQKTTDYELTTRESLSADIFKAIAGIENTQQLTDNTLLLTFSTDSSKTDASLQQLTKTLADKNLTIQSLIPKTRSLEQIFIELTSGEATPKVASAENAA